jgi:hypothetical protein
VAELRELSREQVDPPPFLYKLDTSRPSPRTNWTRLVLLPVLTGQSELPFPFRYSAPRRAGDMGRRRPGVWPWNRALSARELPVRAARQARNDAWAGLVGRAERCGGGGAARTFPGRAFCGTRRVQLVRRDGRDVSTLYGREGERGGGGAFCGVTRRERRGRRRARRRGGGAQAGSRRRGCL